MESYMLYSVIPKKSVLDQTVLVACVHFPPLLFSEINILSVYCKIRLNSSQCRMLL